MDYTNKELNDNLALCPSFDRCSLNLCPLDLGLDERTGSKSEQFKYMREPRKTTIKDKEFTSGGAVMPDELLRFVPKNNLRWLNNGSKQRAKEIPTQIAVKAL